MTLGGSRSLCDQLLTNPFYQVPGFEGTARFTNPTLSRFELARPCPAFTGFNKNSLNLGSMTYDSLQFVANKRWAKGFTINVGYTWVPRWTEEGANTTTGIGNAYVDEVSLLKNSGPYFSHREHRITASGVWELPWYRSQRSIAGYLLGGWSIAPAFVYQAKTGKPDFVALWAGQAAPLSRALPAGELVAKLTAEAVESIQTLKGNLHES